MKVAIRVLGLVCALLFVSSVAKADWLDSAASWSPFSNLDALKPVYLGRKSSSAELNRTTGKDLVEHYIHRGTKVKTQAEWNQVFETYYGLTQAQKHVIYEYLNNQPNMYPVVTFLAQRHFYRSPKNFVSLLRTFKYAASPRAVGATGSNLLAALPADVRVGAIDLLRSTETATNSFDLSTNYTIYESGWKTYEADQENFIFSLRRLAASGKLAIPYRSIYKRNLDPRVDELENNTLHKYDANGDGLIAHAEATAAENSGNQHRNDGTYALMDFILADISAGNAERGVGMFMTRSPHTAMVMLESARHQYYIAPLALLLDAVLEENVKNPLPHLYCMGDTAVASTVAKWIIEVQHARYVAQMLPLMKHRQRLISALKSVPGVDFKSQDSPFAYLEEMGQKWGEIFAGKGFKLDSDQTVNYADLLARYADGTITL